MTIACLALNMHSSTSNWYILISHKSQERVAMMHSHRHRIDILGQSRGYQPQVITEDSHIFLFPNKSFDWLKHIWFEKSLWPSFFSLSLNIRFQTSAHTTQNGFLSHRQRGNFLIVSLFTCSLGPNRGYP